MDHHEPSSTLVAGSTLVDRVMQVIRSRISGRSLTPGSRLPSIRQFAETMQVSKSTIVTAYDRLAAEGVIQSRRGSGFFLAGPLLVKLDRSEIGPRFDRTVDPLWISRQSLEAGDDYLKPGCGWLPPEWMPDAVIRRGLRSLSRGDSSMLVDYATPLGHEPLRQMLARRVSAYGVGVQADQIMLTESGTQALDLLCRSLLKPGETVLVDDPCYFNFHALLSVHHTKVASVPFTPDGPDLERFQQALIEHRPSLYITNSAQHNPTGATLSPVVAHNVLKLAEQHNVTIIEDDTFADFEHNHAPRLSAFDGYDRVVQVGSFSKTLSASIRCGFVTANHDLIDRLADIKIATSFGGGSFSSELICNLLMSGAYEKHLETLRAKLAKAMGETSARLKSIGIAPWIEPKAGMYLWCRLPEGLDAAEIAQKALSEKIVLAPGNAFSVSASANRFLRFNAAQSLHHRIYDFLEQQVRT